MDEKGLKIVELRAENVKRLSAVRIRPDGNVITIGGENAAGKSSVLDAIAYAIGGKALVPAEPIRRGQKRAEVQIDLGDLTIGRTFTKAGSYLTVKNAAGVPAQSPQALLDGLAGKLMFDPLEFSRMRAAEQLETLKGLVGLDFGKLNAEREKAYEERRDVNRDAKALDASLGAMTIYHEAPKQTVSIADLLKELAEARKVNDANAQEQRQLLEDQKHLQLNERLIEDCDMRLAETKLERERLEKSRKELNVGFAVRNKKVEDLQDVPVDPIREQIESAAETNRQVVANRDADERRKELQAAREKADGLTHKIDSIDDEKQQQLAAATFPIDGLGFDEDGVRFRDVPFEQSSEAERIQVSAAIGLALHPKLRVLFIRAGEKLDQTHRKQLAEWAVENDAQLWIEDCRAQETGEATVVIEDGTIKEGGA